MDVNEFYIPSNAYLGYTRLRVKGYLDGSSYTSGACGTTTETEDYLVNIVANGSACSGMPAAVSINPIDTLCPSRQFRLSSNGFVSKQGMICHWEKAALNGSTWTPISGATDVFLEMPNGIVKDSQFRFVVTCTNGNNTVYSNPVTVHVKLKYACYCQPDGIPGLQCGTDIDYIFVDNNMISGWNTISNDTITMSGGVTKNFQITFDVCISGYTPSGVEFHAWIDTNRNGFFDEGDVMSAGGFWAGNTIVQGVTLPINITPGYTYMRLRSGQPYGNNNLDACSESSTGNFFDLVIKILPPNPPTISIVSSNANVCQGVPITFTSTITNGGQLPTYQWYQNNQPIVGATNINFASSTLSNGDVIYCILTSSNYGNFAATSNSIIVNITNNVTPVVNITANPTVICQGQTVTFTAYPVNGGFIPSFQWLINGGSVGNGGNTISLNYLTPSDSISCIMVSTENCASPVIAISNKIGISYQTALYPSISISNYPNAQCAGQIINFVSNVLNTGTNPNYQWKINGLSVSGATNNSFSTPNLLNGQMVSCDLTTYNSCAGTSTVTSNLIVANINPTVIPSIQITASDSTICLGDSVTFSATASNGGNNPVYLWKVNGINTGINLSSITTNALYNNIQISCGLISSAVCAVPDTAISDTITMTVNMLPIPIVTTLSNSNMICPGGSVSLSAFTGLGYSYQWLISSIVISGATDSIYNTLVAGDFSVIKTDLNGCFDTSFTINITTASIVNLTITSSGNVLYATSLLSGYQWYYNGNPIAGATNQFYIPNLSGNYYVVAMDTTGCNWQSNTISFTVGIETVNNAEIFSVFPNPFKENILVKCPSEKGTIRIMDVVGKLIEEQDVMSEIFMLDTKALPNGVYLLRYENKEMSATVKIVKE